MEILKILGIIAIVLGCIYIADGVGSIIKYWSQTLLEHSVRVFRALGGVGLIIMGLILLKLILKGLIH